MYRLTLTSLIAVTLLQLLVGCGGEEPEGCWLAPGAYGEERVVIATTCPKSLVPELYRNWPRDVGPFGWQCGENTISYTEYRDGTTCEVSHHNELEVYPDHISGTARTTVNCADSNCYADWLSTWWKQ